ncbi:hypothetical protein [Yersinia rohdei]|uniref:hypothetical protein n=1 Tax=Yersinia rohdei TaxID=29485 RepID=UPI0011A15C6A|nr:hypothetical protein [Yersinia rohdei]
MQSTNNDKEVLKEKGHSDDIKELKGYGFGDKDLAYIEKHNIDMNDILSEARGGVKNVVEYHMQELAFKYDDINLYPGEYIRRLQGGNEYAYGQLYNLFAKQSPKYIKALSHSFGDDGEVSFKKLSINIILTDVGASDELLYSVRNGDINSSYAYVGLINNNSSEIIDYFSKLGKQDVNNEHFLDFILSGDSSVDCKSINIYEYDEKLRGLFLGETSPSSEINYIHTEITPLSEGILSFQERSQFYSNTPQFKFTNMDLVSPNNLAGV